MCLACGQDLSRALTASASPEAVHKALEASRKALVDAANARVDSSFARALVDRAEQTEAAGDSGKALELARGARRALDLAKRRARLRDTLAHADEVLKHARDAGIETTAFQRTIDHAEALAITGDHAGAEKLLRRISVRTLDQRRERLLQTILDKAEAHVAHARERGARVADAEGSIADAREALAVRDYGKIRGLASRAIARADAARRYARAEDLLEHVIHEMNEAREGGVNIAEARKYMTAARDALRRGVYADVQELARRARHALRESRQEAQVTAVLREVERELGREKRQGADAARAETLLEEAGTALASKEFSKVRSLAKDVHIAVREAALLKRVQDATASLRLDAQDLRAMGADAQEFESVLAELGSAMDAKDLANARRLVAHARHSAEAAREAHFRNQLEHHLTIVLANAARGLDPALARDLLRQADDAISLGQQLDLQKVIDRHLASADAELEATLNKRVVTDRDEIVRLRTAGHDTVAMEGKLADAAIAIQARRFLNADALLDAVEHDMDAIREFLRSEAAEALGRVRGEIDHARVAGTALDPSVDSLVQEAETAYSEGRYGDAVYISKSCIDGIQTAAQAVALKLKEAETRDAETRAEKLKAIQARLDAVRSSMDELVKEEIDLTVATQALTACTDALGREAFDEAERHVSTAEGVVQGMKEALQQRAKAALERARAVFGQAKEEGIASPEMEAALSEIELAFQENRSIHVVGASDALVRSVEDRRRTLLLEQQVKIAEEQRKIAEDQRRIAEEQKNALDKAKTAAAKFITVKKLIEDLRKADIDITGAEESLRAAEQAMEQKAFDDVDSILADLDATAKDLMGELIGAAKGLIARAEQAVQDGKAQGVDVSGAADILRRAHEHFDREAYAEAAENARAAEKQVVDGIESMNRTKEAERRRAEEAARGELAGIRRILADLGRADITILIADESVERAEAAFEAGRFGDVPSELADVKEIASGLSGGLEAAAKDLVQVAERKVTEAKSAGVAPGRAEMVLLNAREAIDHGRYVEAIEYKKVIEDILVEASRDRVERGVREHLSEYRAQIDSYAKLGADMHLAAELYAKAEERLSHGDTEGIQEITAALPEAIRAAGQAHLNGLVVSLAPMIEEGVELGLPRAELDELKTHAAEAAEAGDLEAVYRIRGDLQEKLLDARRQSLVRKSHEEVRAMEDLLVQSERLGIPVTQARAHLDQARRAMDAGDVDGFEHALAKARSSLEESRTSHFASRYEQRLHSTSAMIANAKRLGAEIGEAEASLGHAEEALRNNDLAMADILIKQAEVSVGIQIANFIKNRYPNLVVRLPATGLQAGIWNRYVFEVENKGKLPARNVEFAFDGGMEVKGSQPIAELGVDETKLVEIGLKPSDAGEVPLGVNLSYQRMFDENRYELKDQQTVEVASEGTYLVEDVFLIHGDGRLISHRSRKFREEIDEDIFSGMLTVVQDFVKDSYKRSRTALKRIQFGDSTILIERSPHAFLATVLVGSEPRLLPLYMVQVLKEVEDRFGAVLENWSGLLHQLDGVDDVISKLLFVAQNPDAVKGELEDSPVTLTARVIEALGAAQTVQANDLLVKAQSTLETDIQLAWQFIEQARVQAEAAQNQLGSRMSEMLAAARDTVQEMKSVGADVTQAELLLKEAEEAFHEKKYERVREIHQSLHESLERSKGEAAGKRMEIELSSLINDIQIAKSQNLDVREAESFLSKIESAIQRKNYRQMEDYLHRAKDSLARQRRHTVLTRAQEEIGRLRGVLAEAKEVHADLGDAGQLVDRAETAMRAEDLKILEPLVDQAGSTVKTRVEQVLKDRYPRLFLATVDSGLQANRWNRLQLRIENKGDWPAKDVVPIVNGPAEVEGLRAVPKIDPNETVVLEFGLRPREAGTMDLDLEVHHTRPLDEAKHQVTDSKVVRVEAEGGYVVDDAVLVHADGSLIAHLSRPYRFPEEASKVNALETNVVTLATKGRGGTAKGLVRVQMGGYGVLGIRAPQAFLAITVKGQEPKVLPLYLLQVLRDIQRTYGDRLASGPLDPSLVPGIRDMLRKVLFATDVEGVSLGPLEDSPVSKIPELMDRGLLGGKDGDFVGQAVEAIEAGGYEEGERVLAQVAEASRGPTEEISSQIQKAILAVKESGTLQLTDEQVSAYVEALRKALEATFQAKHRAGIERYWPVSRIAIKASDPLAYDAISAFRKIIVSQSGAKELDIIAPDETWRGMKIDIDVHMDSVSASYKLWAKKIEILLRSQDAWKIKAGLEKGEYSVGIEGQKVRIDPTMVSFVESVPQHVVEEPFDGGNVYLDTRMSKDLLAEGFAREIVNIVRESRREMRIPDEAVVEVDVVASASLRGMLKPWRDLVVREANALEVRFGPEPPDDAFVTEARFGQERLVVGVRSAQM